ncbi:MAG: BamA/OMP85 family outer membrane protein [Candidatus Bipolaricaulaceae bacterium]
MKRALWLVWLVAAVGLAWGMAAWAQEPFTVGRLVVVGNENVPAREILAACGLQVGDTVDVAEVREAAKAVQDLGYFAKVTPELQREEGQVVVRFKVVEYPKIQRITLRGVAPEEVPGGTLWAVIQAWLSAPPQVSEGKVRSILRDHDIRPGQVLNQKRLEEALQEVMDAYREKDLATVQVGQVVPGEELVIEIQQLPVLGHRFQGLATVPESVAREMISVPAGEVGRLSQIQASLRRLSASVYFRQVDVAPELGDGGVWLRWQLSERVLLPEPVAAGELRLVGMQALDPQRISQLAGPLPQGKIDNYHLLRALSPVNDYYRREGLFMVSFAPAEVVDGTLRVEVREGRIDRIELQGEPETRAGVIRRVMDLAEGQLLTEARFMAARQALMALGYFKDVTLEPAWQDGELVLTVSVVEQRKLGSVRGSMTYSPKDQGLVGNLEYAQKNLLGTAQDISVSLSRGITGQGRTTWRLGYRGHAFPVYDLVGFDVYREDAPQEEGSLVTLGGKVTLAYPLAHYLDLTTTLTSEQSWRSPEGVSLDPRTTLEVGLAFDDRDDPNFPRRGHAGRLTVEKAGTFAPGAEYLILRGELARFLPVDLTAGVADIRIAWAQRALVSLGWDLPSRYKFELGGVDSVRGTQKVRTDSLALLNSELRFELAEGFSLALFWDLGAGLWEGPGVKTSVGVEIAANIAGMFVRIDMAWPNDRDFSWVPVFEFAMTPMF